MTAPRPPSTKKRQRLAVPGGKKRRAYTMSAAAKAQRRAAAPAATRASLTASTGPITEAGKAASSRNAWKHGARSAVHRKSFALGSASLSKLFGKPCVTTCPHHPDNPERTTAPCSLVVENLTRAGGDCLDKTVYLHAFDMMMAAITEGDMDGMSGFLASQQAANFEMLQGLRSEIARNGWTLTIPAVDKDGEVIYDKDGHMVPAKFVPNPGIMPYIMLLEKLGINLPELMLTPKARANVKTDEDNAGSLQSFMATLAQRANAALPRRTMRDVADIVAEAQRWLAAKQRTGAALVTRSGLTQDELARRLKISKRSLRCYQYSGPSALPMPYLVQYALECLPKAKG